MKRLLVLIIIILVFNIAGYNAIFNTTNKKHQQLTEQLSEIGSDMNILLQLSEIK